MKILRNYSVASIQREFSKKILKPASKNPITEDDLQWIFARDCEGTESFTILLINTYYWPNMVGGAEQSTKLLAENLVKAGHKVYVVSCDSDGKNRKAIHNGVINYKISTIRKSKPAGKMIHKLIAHYYYNYGNKFISKQIISIISKLKPDVVHCNNFYFIDPCIFKNLYSTLRDV